MAERVVLSSEQGKVEIEDPDKSEQLSKVLGEPAAFIQFVQNPREFVRGYGIAIDQQVSDRLHEALQGVKSAEELQTAGYTVTTRPSTQLTAWAVASGAFAFATSKAAVAF